MSLTTLDNIKTYLQITTTVTDALLTLYRDLIESEIEAFVNNKLIENTYTEVLEYPESRKDLSKYIPFNTNGDPLRLYLKNSYVTTFTMLSEGTTVSNDSYDINEDNGVITMYTYLDDSEEKLTASYTAGYTTATAPTDLQGVVYEGVRSLYENNQAAKQGAGNVKGKRIKDFSVDYGNTSTAHSTVVGDKIVKRYLESNRAILDKYTKINV